VKKTVKHVSEIPAMDDEDLELFWEEHGPEDFQGWTQEGKDKRSGRAKRIEHLAQTSPVFSTHRYI
jgi:hypothetical protein